MSAIRVGRLAGAAELPNPWHGASAAAAGLLAAVTRRMRNRAGERELAALSDAQLRDLGIVRSEIAHVAWHGRR